MKFASWPSTLFLYAILAFAVNAYFRDSFGMATSSLVAVLAFLFAVLKIPPALKCRFDFHNWSMWSEKTAIQKCRFAYATGKKIENSEFYVFKIERRCQDCRVIEVKEVYS